MTTYRFKIDTPWGKKGVEVSDQHKCSDFPDIFEPIPEEDPVEKCPACHQNVVRPMKCDPITYDESGRGFEFSLSKPDPVEKVAEWLCKQLWKDPLCFQPPGWITRFHYLAKALIAAGLRWEELLK